MIDQVRAIVRECYGIALDVARELYPAEWRGLRPRLLTLATWVGYDTDGRADIGWTVTFAKRLMVQLDQLRHYRLPRGRAWRWPAASRRRCRCSSCWRRGWRWRSSRPRTISPFSTIRAPGCGVAQAPGADRARHGDRAAAAGSPTPAQVLDLVERALATAEDDRLAKALCILRAELLAQGLFGAGTHVRINAVQLHNAIRKTIGMDHAPDDPTHRLTYVNAIARLIETAEPQTINFASVTDERATARRMFMTVTQMLKHLDGSEPIRFLIAECDTPFTLLTALYFARAVRRRRPDRHLAPVRDPHRPGARGGDHRRCARGPGLSRLSARPRPDLHPDRLFRCRPLHGPAGRLRADREDPARHGSRCWRSTG